MNLNRILIAGAAILAVGLAGCAAEPSGIVVSGTVTDRLQNIVVAALPAPAVNLDAGFLDLTGRVDPVTGRTSPLVSTAGSVYGLGSFVRLTDVRVAVGDSVRAGQPLATVDTAAQKAQLAAARADAAVAAAQVGLLADAIDATFDKQADVEDAKAKVSDAIDTIRDTRAMLLSARATIRKNLPRARAGLAQINAAIATLPPGVPVPPALQQQKEQLEKVIGQGETGLRKIAAALPRLAQGLRKATAGLRKLEDALATIAEARGSLRDLKELAGLQATAMQIPIAVVRAQLVLADLTSPVDGVVVAVASPGAALAPGATVASVRQSGASRVTAWLSSSQLAGVCESDPATIAADWLPAGVAARLSQIGTRADYPPTSVATDEVHLTRAVEVEFTTAEQLPAGMPVELTINSCHPAAGNTATDR